MSNDLFNGVEQETIFKASLEINPLKSGETLANNEELRKWLQNNSVITIKSQNKAMFSYTSGPATSASPSDRDKPRILFNEDGVYIGVAVYVPAVQNWSITGVPGEIKTVQRSANTVEEDMEEKFLFGWFVCDGTTGAVDLLTQSTVTDSNSDTHTPNSPFFKGTGPDYDLYTVQKLA